MRNLTVLLACTTILFAGTTLYLWLDRRFSVPTELPSAMTPAVPESARNPANASDVMTATPTSNGPGGTSRGADSDDQAVATPATSTPAPRATLEPAVRHEDVLRELRVHYRRNDPRLAASMGMSEDEYERLMSLLATQQLRGLEAKRECDRKPGCEIGPLLYELEARRERELVELLGPGKSSLFGEYRDNGSERNQVTYLRGVLPDSAPMTNQQADALVAALGDERRKIMREWEQRGAHPQGTSNMRGTILVPSTAQGIEQKTNEAAEYQRRLNARAGAILDRQQLEAFAQIQADLLEQVRIGWEHAESMPP